MSKELARLSAAFGPRGPRGMTVNIHHLATGGGFDAVGWGLLPGPAVVELVVVQSPYPSGILFAAASIRPMVFYSLVGVVSRPTLAELVTLGFPLVRTVGARVPGDVVVALRGGSDRAQLIWPRAYVPQAVWCPGFIYGQDLGAGARSDVSMSIRFLEVRGGR